MAKHVGFFLVVCFIFSAPFGRTYGAANNKQRKELDFADIQKHFESMTSASTSMGDIKDAVLPFLNNYRTKRSSGVDIAGKDPVNVPFASPKKPPSSQLPVSLRRKRSGLDEYIKDLEKVIAVPKAVGQLVKKVKNVVEKVKNVSEAICKNCEKDVDMADEYYDDYYYDDEDYSYRKKRNIKMEDGPQRPKGPVERLVGMVQTMNGRVIGRTKSLVEAGMDAAEQAVRAAFGLISGRPGRERRSLEITIIDYVSQMVQRFRRANPEFAEQAATKITDIMKDCALIVINLFKPVISSLQTVVSNLRDLRYFIVEWLSNSRSRRSVQNAMGAGIEWLDQTIKEVKKVATDVSEKVKSQVLTNLGEIADVVSDYKSRLERGRRSIEDVKFIRKRDVSTSNPVETPTDGKTETARSNPDGQENDTKTTPKGPASTTQNPLVNSIDTLTNITDSVTQVLDLVSDLVGLFARRRRRDADLEVPESQSSFEYFLIDVQNGAVEALSNIKNVIGRTIQEVGQSVDSGLQMISSTLSRRRRSAVDDDQTVAESDIDNFLLEIPQVIIGELSPAIDELKKWFNKLIISNGKFYNLDVDEVLQGVNSEIDLLQSYFSNAPTSTDAGSAETDVQVDGEIMVGSTGLIRKKRFLLLGALTGMMLSKATAKVTQWIFDAVKNKTSDVLDQIQSSEEGNNGSNRLIRETDKNLLGDLFDMPGKILEKILQTGKEGADAIIRVLNGGNTEDPDNIYPGRR